MSAVPIVELAKVSKAFGAHSGHCVVLDEVDLTIQAGDKVSIMGPSGSGKSTLLSLIAGLVSPDSGVISIEGKPLAQLNDGGRAALRAHRIGIALQSDNLIPFLTARENVELAGRFAGRTLREAEVDGLLERMGVGHRRNHLPRQLSGGETQRVSLAVALANDPVLLLADEMVAQLDGATAGPVIDEVFNSNIAVLYVTHDPALAARASRRLCLHDHKVVL